MAAAKVSRAASSARRRRPDAAPRRLLPCEARRARRCLAHTLRPRPSLPAQATASAALALALLLALGAPRRATAQCTGSTYSYGGLPCAPCASGSTFVSTTFGCAPSAALLAGPVDTAFFLSGTAAEGTSAFRNVSAPAGITYTIDPFGVSNGAASFASGSFLSAPGASAPLVLPAGGSAAISASAWVRCSAPPASYSSVLGWGAPGDVSTISASSVTATSVALVVSGTGLLPNSGTVASFVGSSTTVAGTTDGTGTNALFNGPRGLTFIPSNGNIIVTDQTSHCLREITPAGVVTTFAGLCGTAAWVDATGTNARFNTLSGIAYMPATGGLVIADNSNHRMRLVTYPGAVVTTFAGTGVAGFLDATGLAAQFNTPAGVAGWCYLALRPRAPARRPSARRARGRAPCRSLHPRAASPPPHRHTPPPSNALPPLVKRQSCPRRATSSWPTA